jgi:ClpP class serine protease
MTPIDNLWAIESSALARHEWAMMAMAATGSKPAKVAVQVERDTYAPGVATMRVSGMMTPRDQAEQYSAVAYEDIADTARMLRDDPAVRAVVLELATPGGTVSGLEPALNQLRALASSKPLMARVIGQATSGGAWLASAASKVFADRNSLLGSVGVIVRMMDWSKAFAEMGIKPVIVASGENKNFIGTFGEPIDERMQANMRSLIMPTFEDFKAAMLGARPGLEDEVLDGRVIVATDTEKSRGLADEVGSSIEIQAAITGELGRMFKDIGKEAHMETPAPVVVAPVEPAPAPEPAPQPVAATFAELKAVYGDYPAFIVKAQEESMTMADAAKAFVAFSKIANVSGAKPVVASVTAGERAPAAGTAEAFTAKAEALMAGGCSKLLAIHTASKEDPKGYAAWLATSAR